MLGVEEELVTASRTIHSPNHYGYCRGSNRGHKSCPARQSESRGAIAKSSRRETRRNACESECMMYRPARSDRPRCQGRIYFTRRYVLQVTERRRSLEDTWAWRASRDTDISARRIDISITSVNMKWVSSFGNRLISFFSQRVNAEILSKWNLGRIRRFFSVYIEDQKMRIECYRLQLAGATICITHAGY